MTDTTAVTDGTRSGLLSRVLDELLRTLQPLLDAAQDPGILDNLLAELGAQDPRLTGGLVQGLTELGQGVQQIRQLFQTADELSLQDAGKALDALREVFTGLRDLASTSAGAPYPEIGADLLNILLLDEMRNRVPLAYQALLTLGFIEYQVLRPISIGAEVVRPPQLFERILFGRLAGLFDKWSQFFVDQMPSPMLSTVDHAQQTMDNAVNRLGCLLSAFNIPWSYSYAPGAEQYLGDSLLQAAHTLVVYVPTTLVGDDVRAGFCVHLSSADADDLGIVITPFGDLAISGNIGAWTLAASVSAEFDSIAFAGGRGTMLLSNAGATELAVNLTAAIAPLAPGTPAYVLGSPTGSRLELGAPTLAASLSIATDGVTLGFSGDTGESALVIDAGDGDGFLASLLPAGGLHANFALGLDWSNKTGLHWKDNAGLDATLPVGLSFAGVTLSAIHLGLNASGNDVAIDMTASLAATIGPVTAVLDRIGIAAQLDFADNDSGGGSIGVADLALGFQPPSGIGLTVDAQGLVTGGGFLFHDAVNALYAGVLQVSIREELTLTAFGLVGTRMPDGSRGYSIVIFLTASDFQPVPLGLGFTLQGIGGMVAIHRTFSEDAVRAGLKNDTLKSLLFPANPVANATAVVAALQTVFPAQRGSYLVGLLLRIGWFTPTLVQMDLGVMVEFGVNKKLIVLGRISSLLPSPDNDLVRLNLDALGVLDFDQGTASIDALLVDSKLAHKFVLTGAMALRARWGSGPGSVFVFAIGGLNPHFTPPANLPTLARIGIALSSGSNPRLTCDAYFAITSNTVQFGARAQLHAQAYGFSVDGDVGYDVLLQLSPLHFIADFEASLQLKHGSSNLFMVSVSGELEGPRPLRVSGKASFSILWCDFSISFDKTLIDGESPPPPTAIDVLSVLRTALSTPQSWRTVPAATGAQGVTLKPLAADAGLVLDPLGRLSVVQQTVPLDRAIDLFGGAPVAGANTFHLTATIDDLPPDAPPLATAPLGAQFAPTQFFTMNDDDKLAAPSFETLDAGLVFGSDALSFDDDEVVPAPMTYESIVIDSLQAPRKPPGPPYRLAATQLMALARGGAAARAPLRRTGVARFRNAGAPPMATLASPAWVVVPLAVSAGSTAPIPTTVSWSAGLATLQTRNRGGAQWQLLPAHELTD